MSATTDIAIIGGGPVGAALALALRAGNTDLRITVLEARNETAGEPRPIALSHGSRLLLERLGAWHDLHPTPIEHIHVSQRGGFGRVAISAADSGVPALGYVVDYIELFATLTATFAKVPRSAAGTPADYRSGARVTALRRDGDVQRIDYTLGEHAASLTAHLAVVADGGAIDGLAPPKVLDYGQHALIARVTTTLPHRHVAYERFTRDGPLALLPFDSNLSKEMALVWTLPPARAETLLHADAPTFLAALRAAFGTRLGDFTGVSQRACYPLSLRHATADSPPGVVTIGNAAQTLHPVAGQGFNLGLRDAWELAQIITQALRTDRSNNDSNNDKQALPDFQPLHAALRDYRAQRRLDRSATIATTHTLVRLFSNDFLPLQAARGIGMTALGCIAPLRDLVARRMIFGARG